MITRVREKGQVTIPADIREALRLDKDSVLSVSKVGDGILLTRKPSVFEKTAEGFIKEAQERGITLDDLLADLKKMRRSNS